MTTVRSRTQPSPIRERMPTMESWMRERLMMLPSQRMELCDVGLEDLRSRQEAGVGEDRPLLVVEVELGQGLGQVQVGLEEGRDGPDVLPVAVEEVGEDLAARGWPRG